MTSAKDVVASSDVTFVMLSSPDAALQVYTSPDGILAGLAAGKSIVECASLDSDIMRQFIGENGCGVRRAVHFFFFFFRFG